MSEIHKVSKQSMTGATHLLEYSPAVSDFKAPTVIKSDTRIESERNQRDGNICNFLSCAFAFCGVWFSGVK